MHSEAARQSSESSKPSQTAAHREGPVARAIEKETAKIPSDAFLWASLASMGASLALELSGRDKAANFVAHWAPTLLVLGLYNKIVKLHGSDPAGAPDAQLR
jgi:hypothetical protein